MSSVPRTELAPIPEAPECWGEPDWESAGAPCDPVSPSSTDRSEAMTDGSCEDTDGERAERAAERAAVKREPPARRLLNGWPADREVTEVRGRVTLRGSADPQAESMPAVCRIRAGVLTLNIEERAAAGAKTEVVVAEAPVEALAARLHRGRADMFALATVYENEMFDEIYCFCDDPAKRDRWIEVFRRMGVAVFDSRD